MNRLDNRADLISYNEDNRISGANLLNLIQSDGTEK